MRQIQAVTIEDLYRDKITKPFNMIDNYIYIYHTKTLLALPMFPESIQDSMQTMYAANMPMSRSAPIFSYSNSGPRSMQIELPLHRDMMNSINVDNSTLFSAKIYELSSDDYVDTLINQLQSIALPKYAAAEKMINPPMVAVRFGNSIFCKGVVDGGVTATHSCPILENNKYALVNIAFTIKEVDPYEATTVALEGGFRGLRTTLERRIFKSASSSNNINYSTI